MIQQARTTGHARVASRRMSSPWRPRQLLAAVAVTGAVLLSAFGDDDDEGI